MTKRILFFALPCLVLLPACPDPPPTSGDPQPYIDDWEVVGTADIAAFPLVKLTIGDRLTMDNFANRGDVEVIFASSAGTTLTVEMQRFTIASSQESADEAFERMQFWAYNSDAAVLNPATDADKTCLDFCVPSPEGPLCGTAKVENDSCSIRTYYNGQTQPVRDGANFRVTLPLGWTGDLEIVTADNINDGLEKYPDRSDVRVTDLTGTLDVDLDSGNVEVKVSDLIDHYAGCAANDACENGDLMADPIVGPFDPGCGCLDPTFVTVKNATGQASNVTIDIPTISSVNDAPRWYDVKLENTGNFSGGSDFVCTATVQCADFPEICAINPDFASLEYKEWATINFPGEEGNPEKPAVSGTGIQINVTSQDCANIAYLEDAEDYELEFPLEQRGNLLVCSGCL